MTSFCKELLEAKKEYNEERLGSYSWRGHHFGQSDSPILLGSRISYLYSKHLRFKINPILEQLVVNGDITSNFQLNDIFPLDYSPFFEEVVHEPNILDLDFN